MNAPKSYLHFDGSQSYIEIPDSSDFSLTTTGSLTVSAWIRPEVLIFPTAEKGFVHWMGKGEAGKQEWVFRMYSQDNNVGRDNRISFYVFNPEGGEGIGSYYQDPNNPVQAGVWLHAVGAADTERTYIYINGAPIDTDVYAGQIQPQHGTAPLRIGTRDLKSFFEGEIREVRIWNRKLADEEVAALFASVSVPQDGLVGEYLLTQDVAPDTAEAHNGVIYGANWIPQGN
ncbi:MAG: LamG domain-containing protein [Acidobacteriia bacterium]|nr:LamG domain-containing protein [Terriglobia bacterium]